MFKKELLMSFVLTGTNRTNELSNINKVFRDSIPYISKEDIRRIARSGSSLANLLKIFKIRNLDSRGLKSLADKIDRLVLDFDNTSGAYIELVTHADEVIYSDSLTERQHQMLISIYHYISIPVILHKFIMDTLLNTWKILKPDSPLVSLFSQKLLFGSPYYIKDVNASQRAFKSHLRTTSTLVTTSPLDYIAVNGLKTWINTKSYDVNQASLSTAFVEYGTVMSSALDKDYPALITQLDVLKINVIDEHRTLRKVL